jgi:hypothetical protein
MKILSDNFLFHVWWRQGWLGGQASSVFESFKKYLALAFKANHTKNSIQTSLTPVKHLAQVS